MVEEAEIVIVGGGLCGLATALALHRKGIRSVVLERSEELRASGGAIGIRANGWRALHQLGLASALRQTAHHIEGGKNVWLDKGITKQVKIGTGETRCLRRNDLINALANALPPGTIRFGCQLVSVKLDPLSSLPVLQLLDGRSIVAEVLIGCDGSKSVVAEFLNLSPVKEIGLMAVRGLTNYPNGHQFPHEFLRLRKNNILVGAIPVDDKAMYWFVSQQSSSYKGGHSTAFPDPETIRNLSVESIKGYPVEIIKMFEASDLDTLSLTRLRYRSPWALLFGNFRKGTVTVAGDAMHVMGPFLGQGGSAGLEDAIILARCLSKEFNKTDFSENGIGRKMMTQRVGEAMDEYLKERRMRVVRLSMQTYLTGSLFMPSTPLLVRFTCIVLMIVLFINPDNHTSYDCGIL